MEGSGNKLKRTLADRIASQESVEKKFQKTNLAKKKKIENKKQKRLAETTEKKKRLTSEEDGDDSQSLGSMEISSFKNEAKSREDKSEKSTGEKSVEKSGGGEKKQQQHQQQPLSSAANVELVSLINDSNAEKLRVALKLCIRTHPDLKKSVHTSLSQSTGPAPSQPLVNVRPRVFFEITIAQQPAVKITMELFNDIVPRTAENFRQLCTGEKGIGNCGKKLWYKNSPIHRIIPGFMAQGGDITAGNGTGGESIYGRNFKDENFKMKHTGAGILSMANSGPNTNGSQFFICFGKTDWLDGAHVVFGKVIDGLPFLKKLESYGSQGEGKPKAAIRITNSGQV